MVSETIRCFISGFLLSVEPLTHQMHLCRAGASAFRCGLWPTKIKISSAYTARELLPVVDQLSAAWRTLLWMNPHRLPRTADSDRLCFGPTAGDAAARFNSLARAHERKPRNRAKFPEPNRILFYARVPIISDKKVRFDISLFDLTLNARQRRRAPKHPCGRPSGTKSLFPDSLPIPHPSAITSRCGPARNLDWSFAGRNADNIPAQALSALDP